MTPEMDSAGVYFLTREEFEGRTSEPAPAAKKTSTCNECSSTYYTERSEMASLCPECAHRLHGYPACKHQFQNGRCERCYWDGSTSDDLAASSEWDDPR